MVDKIKAQALAAETQKKRGEAFITRAKLVHRNQYDYSQVVYLRAATKVKILCSEHGTFEQTPANHVNGQGCPECALEMKIQMGKDRRLSQEDFISKCKAVHGELYDYSNLTYLSSDKPITISCSKHGPFTIARAEKHYMYAQGCPHCVSGTSLSTPERIIAEVFDELGVLFHKEFKFDDCRSHISNYKLRFDFYVPSKRMLIEFHGEQHFKRSSMMHPGDRFERMQEHDRIKARYAHDNGFTFVVFTTKDMVKLRELVAKLVS